jgi:hypothetical protein
VIRISAQIQILCHLGYEPSAKDSRDVLALCDEFDLLIPEPYRALAEMARATKACS